MSELVIIGNIACTKPATRMQRKLIALQVKRENVRRTPSLWGKSPDYQKAIEAVRGRMQ